MTFLWILLGILYVAVWIYFGLATFRKGHYWLFWIGFIFPVLDRRSPDQAHGTRGRSRRGDRIGVRPLRKPSLGGS